MENVLPKCACGENVLVHSYQVPIYDDGGGLLCVDQGYDVWDTCWNCMVYDPQQDADDGDELPF